MFNSLESTMRQFLIFSALLLCAATPALAQSAFPLRPAPRDLS